jgi:eukaryotic-like serine/threonine-protein kinase
VGVDDQDVARKQLYDAHIPVDRLDPTIPEPLARIIDAAMAKNPNERFLTADHLREALMMYKQGRLSASGSQAPISAVVGSPLERVGYSGGTPPPPPPPPPSYVPASQAARQSSAKKRSGFDGLLLVLGVVAILAVMGLVPLVVGLYQIFVPNESSGNNATPLAALASGQVRMPDIVGLEEEAARSALSGVGLVLVVTGEAPHPTWPAFTIIEQSIPAGAGVNTGSTVNVILSQGPPLIEVPDMRGKNYDEANQLLTSLDLVTQKIEDWSVETPGSVILQDPPPGSLVANRTLITLLVSSGSRVPMEANFGGEVMLKAYEIPRLQFKPGETLPLTFFWQALPNLTKDYNFFVYLTTPQSGIVTQIDGPPQELGPTNGWPKGEVIFNHYPLVIPTSVAPGDYQIRIGFYDPVSKVRIPIAEPGRGEQDNLGALILRSIQVVQ